MLKNITFEAFEGYIIHSIPAYMEECSLLENISKCHNKFWAGKKVVWQLQATAYGVSLCITTGRQGKIELSAVNIV